MTPWTAARQASLSFTVSWSLLRLMPITLGLKRLVSHPVSPWLPRDSLKDRKDFVPSILTFLFLPPSLFLPLISLPSHFSQHLNEDRDFPGGPVGKTSPCNAGGASSILGRELRSHKPQAQNTKHETKEAIL